MSVNRDLAKGGGRGSYVRACQDRAHRPFWRVMVRRANWSAFNGYRHTPSDYSRDSLPAVVGRLAGHAGAARPATSTGYPMAKIATTADKTIWECDSGCGELAESPNAFTLPPGWWTAEIRRRTEVDEYGHGGKPKAGSIDACSKDCLLSTIKYQNQHYVDYLDPDLR